MGKFPMSRDNLCSMCRFVFISWSNCLRTLSNLFCHKRCYVMSFDSTNETSQWYIITILPYTNGCVKYMWWLWHRTSWWNSRFSLQKRRTISKFIMKRYGRGKKEWYIGKSTSLAIQRTYTHAFTYVRIRVCMGT